MTVNYQKIAVEVRKDVLSLVHKGQTSHIGSNLSLVDMAVVLYENLKPEDKCVWSCGWKAALYYILNIRKGILDREEVFNTFPSPPYIGLLERSVKGVEQLGGSMGNGLPYSVGAALAKKISGDGGTIYCFMSDGEVAIGTTWESALLASHHKLNNLVVLLDYNKWQAMGRTNEVINLEPLKHKFVMMGWQVDEIDGHNYQSIEWALNNRSEYLQKPYLIIGNTCKGKGIGFMEDHIVFHYKYVSDEEFKLGMEELNNYEKTLY